jgi:phosphoglycolate phosphatase-like HAD superfamily hydrolase
VPTSTTTVDAVLFDWDGTLMDTKETILRSYREASTEIYGEPYPTEHGELEQLIQLRAKESFLIVARGDEERAAQVGVRFGEAYARNQASATPFDGIADALREIVALGVQVGVATSKARSRFESDAQRAGVRDLFAVTITGDDVTAAKPDPEPVTRAIDELGLEPASCFYVGDGPNDVLAARAAGAVTVGVAWGFHPDECREAGPDLVVERPSDLVDAVRRARGRA